MPHPVLLLISDDPFSRMDAAAIAGAAGFQAIEAVDAETALLLLTGGTRIDAVLLNTKTWGAKGGLIQTVARGRGVQAIVVVGANESEQAPGNVISIQSAYFSVALKVTLRTLMLEFSSGA